MSEIQPALLTRAEIDWLTRRSTNLSKKTERDLRYRINKKLKVFMQTELPLLKDRGFAAAVGNGAAAISSGSSGTEEHRLVGRGVANPDKDIAEVREKEVIKSAGSGTFARSTSIEQNFEPTCPFGHGISNLHFE